MACTFEAQVLYWLLNAAKAQPELLLLELASAGIGPRGTTARVLPPAALTLLILYRHVQSPSVTFTSWLTGYAFISSKWDLTRTMKSRGERHHDRPRDPGVAASLNKPSIHQATSKFCCCTMQCVWSATSATPKLNPRAKPFNSTRRPAAAVRAIHSSRNMQNVPADDAAAYNRMASTSEQQVGLCRGAHPGVGHICSYPCSSRHCTHAIPSIFITFYRLHARHPIAWAAVQSHALLATLAPHAHLCLSLALGDCCCSLPICHVLMQLLLAGLCKGAAASRPAPPRAYGSSRTT